MHVCLSCCNVTVSLGLARHEPVWFNLVAEVSVAIGKRRTRDVNEASGKTSRRTQREDVKTDATERRQDGRNGMKRIWTRIRTSRRLCFWTRWRHAKEKDTQKCTRVDGVWLKKRIEDSIDIWKLKWHQSIRMWRPTCENDHYNSNNDPLWAYGWCRIHRFAG
jgi:hypothetical protein